MKKSLLIVSILLLIIASVIICMRESGSSVKVAGEDKYNSIKAQSASVEDDFVLSYNGENLPYDASSKTFYLPVDMESTTWEIGSFTGSFAGEENAELIFLENYAKTDKQEAIANGKAFPFLAVTGKGYGEYQLVFTGLPIITFAGTDYLADDGTPMFHLKVYDTHHGSEWVMESYTQSRLRGNTSLSYEKKSLRLYLKELQDNGVFVKNNKNLLGIRDDDDWILNSLYADSTRVRDQLCIDLWNEVGANSNPYGYNYGTQATYVEVFINNGYQGLYSLMVPVDYKQLGMDAVSEQMAAGKPLVERVYEKKYTAAWAATDFVGDLPDPQMPDFRGGFYLKGDTILQNEEEWEPLYQVATWMEADDDTFSANITRVTDQQNVIENWLFYQAIAGFDNENKNVYYVARNNNDSYYGYFVPWDMNLSFGAVYAENAYYCEESQQVTDQIVQWQPGQRMMELDTKDSVALAVSTWERWRSGVFSDQALQDRINRLEHCVKDSGAFARESKRWPEGNQNEDFSFLYDFAAERMKAMDVYMTQLNK
ncbi:MAG: CotH kinase family protein [Lachnospiraceae bacterium]|nr:CotH kinase family protein [Lachnospiraceae bacterium]